MWLHHIFQFQHSSLNFLLKIEINSFRHFYYYMCTIIVFLIDDSILVILSESISNCDNRLNFYFYVFQIIFLTSRFCSRLVF